MEDREILIEILARLRLQDQIWRDNTALKDSENNDSMEYKKEKLLRDHDGMLEAFKRGIRNQL